MRPWERLDSKPGHDLIVARQRTDRMVHPVSGRAFDRTVLECPTWCNVVPLTPERVHGDPLSRELVVVRQYRFGRGCVTTEIPGGLVDLGEEHGAAARRELREETGYSAERWTHLGAVEPNPAFQTNLCHHWLAEDCERTHDLDLDAGEDIVVRTIPLRDVPALVADGEIAHSLVVSALCRVLDLRLDRG